MIELLHCNINNLTDMEVISCLSSLPEPMQKEILKYKNWPDQKARIVAGLMLRHFLKEINQEESIHLLKRDQYNKPYIENTFCFNTSHSAEMVVLAKCNEQIGVDIEKIADLNYTDYLGYFHANEQEYISSATNTQFAFFEVWVKKEAALKAIGTGFLNGLNGFSCVENTCNYRQQTWSFYSLRLNNDYTSYACTQNENEEITINEFELIFKQRDFKNKAF